MRLRTGLACCLLLALPAASWAEECAALHEQARKTRDTATSAAAYQACSALAAQKQPEGLYRQGLLMRDGLGTTRDAPGGLELVRRAAAAGLPAAQARLGRIYLRGDGVAADLGEAAAWFSKAAMAGDPLAQYELGQLHYQGQGVAQDAYEAYKWFAAAATAFAQEGNVPRTKLAQRKQQTVAQSLSAADRLRAERWYAEQFGKASERR